MRINSRTTAGILLMGTLLFPISSQAQVTYYSRYRPTVADEINGTFGGSTARSLVAAGLMGAKFYANSIVTGREGTLLDACRSETPSSSTWAEQCNFGGLTSALSRVFGQGWTHGVYPESDQASAINAQVRGLRTYQSPSIVPLYGHADHWATVFEIRTDTTGTVVQYVKFFDSGNSAMYDADFDQYLDGMITQSGSTWRNVFYKVITTVASSDPYYLRYLVSYDPPHNTSPEQLAKDEKAIRAMSMDLAPFPGVIDPKDKMDASTAEAEVWNAIFVADVDKDPIIWRALEQGMAGAAWEVHGRKPSGEPWHYFLVPILVSDREISAMVQLSAVDGALEQIWIPAKPLPFLGTSEETAFMRAKEALLPDELLVGGELTWDAFLNDPHCRSPLLPYYKFHVISKYGEPRGGLLVALDDGVARGIKEPLQSPEKAN